MRIEIVPDEQAVAVRAADIICDAVRGRPDARIGLPTGRTPLAAYAELERREAAGAADFSRVTLYAVDEFADASRTTPGTNSVFFRERLRLRVKALHCPDAGARYPDVHVKAFAAAIGFAGGLDLCVLGIGVNGHIAFNEPGSGRDAGACVVELAEASRAAHAESFGSLDRVPRRGMTLGVIDLLAARAVLVLATGAHKADAVRAAIEGARTAEVPASWLREHGDVTWLLDETAAAKLERRG
jgi:glucosamine-6-phosphate deaminase